MRYALSTVCHHLLPLFANSPFAIRYLPFSLDMELDHISLGDSEIALGHLAAKFS